MIKVFNLFLSQLYGAATDKGFEIALPVNKPAVQAVGQTLPDASPPVGKTHPFSEIVVTVDSIKQFRCPSSFRISKKNVNIVSFMTGSTILNRLGVMAL